MQMLWCIAVALGLSMGEAHDMVSEALTHPLGWQRAGIQFAEGPCENADVRFHVVPYREFAPNAEDALAYMLPPAEVYVPSDPIPRTSFWNLVVNHEVGHVLGLDHSTWGVMNARTYWPSGAELDAVRRRLAESQGTIG